MPDLDEILITLANDLLPSGIQFTFLLMALVGSFAIASALLGIYNNISVDGYSRGQFQSNSGLMLRMLLGGLMVTPSVTLWRAADAFLQGGGTTESDILAYIAGPDGTPGYCTRFGDAIQLSFMLVGAIGLFLAYRAADDQARGFSQTGYRSAIVYGLGGLGCFLISDVMDIIGNTLGYGVGFHALCAAFDE